MTHFVTDHAIERYRQRVRKCSEEEALEALSSPAIKTMCELGNGRVKLGTGQYVVIRDGGVITVTPNKRFKKGQRLSRTVNQKTLKHQG